MSSSKVELLLMEMYEKEKDEFNQVESEILHHLTIINKMGMKERNPQNQMILMSMKCLVLASVFTTDEKKQVKYIQKSKSLKQLLQ